MSSWFSFAKKYLWHEEKTPFHLSPSQMSKLQASNELKLFAIFEGIIAGMMVFGIYSHFQLTGETSLFPGLIYCLFLLCALPLFQLWPRGTTLYFYCSADSLIA